MIGPDPTHEGGSARTRLGTLLASTGALALLFGAAMAPSQALAACSPGTFTGATETCTGSDAAIGATLSTDQSAVLQAETVTTGGVQLIATGATSISLSAPGAAVTTPTPTPTPTKKKKNPPPPPPPPPVASSSIVNSVGGAAIGLYSHGGDISLTTGAGVNVSATGDGMDLTTSGAGAISVVAGGNVTSADWNAISTGAAAGATTISTAAGTTVSGGGASNVAIFAQATSGAITITSNATTSGAIWANACCGGPVTVNVGGNLTFAGNPANSAISATGGSGKIVLAPNVTIPSGGAGLYAQAPGFGTAEIDTGVGSRILATGVGIDLFASGGVTVNSAGAIGAAATPVGGDGVRAEIGQGPYNIAINMTAGAIYAAQNGVEATDQGNGLISITTAAGTFIQAGANGIYAFNRSGPTLVNNGSAVTAAGGDGIGLTGDGGNLSITTTAGGTVSATGASGDGLYVNAALAGPFQAGSVTVVTGANVSSLGGAGIHTTALEGATTITTAAGTTVSGGGPNGAIYATSDNGAITINSNAAATGGIYGMASRTGAVTINVNSNVTTAGPVAIDASGGGLVHVSVGPNATAQSSAGWGLFGLGAGASGFKLDTAAGSRIVSGGLSADVEVTTGQFLLNNAGTLATSVAGHQGTAVYLLSGSVFSLPSTVATLNNAATGVIDGQLLIQNGTTTLNNAGTWNVDGESDFSGGGARAGAINNIGLIQVGLTTPSPTATASVFNGLGAFTNGSSTATGTISMVNGVVGDSLTIAAPFVGVSGHSVLYLDAFLGGAGSTADQLHLAGGSSGVTLISIHNTNPASGALNSGGIVLVTGSSAATTFAINPATAHYDALHNGIDAGLFLYTLADSQGNEVLIGSAGSSGHKLPKATTPHS